MIHYVGAKLMDDSCAMMGGGGGLIEVSAIHSDQGWAGIFRQSMGARNRVGIGLLYQPARLHRLAEFIPWDRFLGSINVYEYGLWTVTDNAEEKNVRKSRVIVRLSRVLSPSTVLYLAAKYWNCKDEARETIQSILIYWWYIYTIIEWIYNRSSHGRMNYKDTEPYMSAFL